MSMVVWLISTLLLRRASRWHITPGGFTYKAMKVALWQVGGWVVLQQSSERVLIQDLRELYRSKLAACMDDKVVLLTTINLKRTWLTPKVRCNSNYPFYHDGLTAGLRGQCSSSWLLQGINTVSFVSLWVTIQSWASLAILLFLATQGFKQGA